MATTTITEKTAHLTLAFDKSTHEGYKYSRYLPVYDEETEFEPTPPFEFTDRGHAADKAKPHLLATGDPNVVVTKLTPLVGTEIRGLQLSQLTDGQKNELALLIAERGVVVFRDQDFKDIGPERQKAFGEYFGRLHPVGAHVDGFLEFHNIYLGPAVPSSGSDTAWVSQVAAYERLSEPIQKLLDGFRAEHSGFRQAGNARRDGKFVRREPVKSEHPVVRVHPITGKKALFINPGFTKRIIGLKDEESDALLQLLFKNISQSQDIQVRVKWDDRTVSLWDNRVTAHNCYLRLRCA